MLSTVGSAAINLNWSPLWVQFTSKATGLNKAFNCLNFSWQWEVGPIPDRTVFLWLVKYWSINSQGRINNEDFWHNCEYKCLLTFGYRLTFFIIFLRIKLIFFSWTSLLRLYVMVWKAKIKQFSFFRFYIFRFFLVNLFFCMASYLLCRQQGVMLVSSCLLCFSVWFLFSVGVTFN